MEILLFIAAFIFVTKCMYIAFFSCPVCQCDPCDCHPHNEVKV